MAHLDLIGYGISGKMGDMCGQVIHGRSYIKQAVKTRKANSPAQEEALTAFRILVQVCRVAKDEGFSPYVKLYHHTTWLDTLIYENRKMIQGRKFAGGSFDTGLNYEFGLTDATATYTARNTNYHVEVKTWDYIYKQGIDSIDYIGLADTGKTIFIENDVMGSGKEAYDFQAPAGAAIATWLLCLPFKAPKGKDFWPGQIVPVVQQ